MISRYTGRVIAQNNYEIYKDIINKRNLNFINHYPTPEYTFPKYADLKDVTMNQHIWTVGDRFYKLAYKFYGDSRDWWIIAKFNNTPTESHIKIGEVIYIPTPLERILNIMKG